MVKREKQEKSESCDKEIISKFINISLALEKVKKIVVEEDNENHDLRVNMNLFIYGSIGGTKSTLLKHIVEKTGCKKPYTTLSFASLLGSIDSQTKQLMLGACWECRKSLMIFDEFDFGKRNKDDIRALLQLSEGGEYNRKIASFSIPLEEIDEEMGLYYKFKDGTFEIKTRFSLIIATMKYPYTSQSMELQALASRSVCLPWYPSKEQIKKVAQGYKLFNYEDKTPKKKEFFVNNKNYNIILDYVFDRTEHTNALRIIGDCVRVFVIEGKHDYKLYDLIIKFGSKEFKSKAKIKEEKEAKKEVKTK